MKVTDTKTPDGKITEPIVFEDECGFFFESFNHKTFEGAIWRELISVQEHHSKSNKDVLRGLHYQLSPHTQGKLECVLQGEVADVAVDIRKYFPTFEQWIAETLSAEKKKQLWIPGGFAYGFPTLSETAEFLYETSNYCAKEHERCIAWDDPDIDVSWPQGLRFQLSDKDQAGSALAVTEVIA
jgi:dTDP-4-dehydrorhamnose 3,5-epimerase